MNNTAAVAPQRKAKILVVDDDPGLLRLLTIRLRAENYDVEAVENGPLALAAASRYRPDLVISDLRMEPIDGIGLLKELQSRWPGLKVIMLTAHGTIPDAVQATQMGAFGFLTKPVEKQELLDQVQKALKISGFADTTQAWRAEFITRSALMEEKLSQAHMVAGTDTAVLLSGETGSGRKWMARAIHLASPRREGPLVIFNCRTQESAESEAELQAQMAAAHEGTLVLDELTELPPRLQTLLLKMLQENSTRTTASNVRILSTCLTDPAQKLRSSSFRDDLQYRLNVVQIDIPPLSKRREDIPMLVAHFLAELSRETGQARSYAPEAVELLTATEWPGNVLQLRSVVQQNFALSPTPVIPLEMVQQSLGGGQANLPSFDAARDEFTRNYLSQILQITGGNVSQAARLAKRNRTDFYKLLGRHQLVPDDFKVKS